MNYNCQTHYHCGCGCGGRTETEGIQNRPDRCEETRGEDRGCGCGQTQGTQDRRPCGRPCTGGQGGCHHTGGRGDCGICRIFRCLFCCGRSGRGR